MTEKQFPAAKAGGAVRVLNARKDPPDIRDRYYEPALIQLKPEMDNREGAVVLDQGQEGACTGFGLAAVINRLHAAGSEKTFIASPRMLYEMAKKHDEWPGEDYAGSSCRGAIRGWKNMGVCEEEDWPYRTDDPGELTVERARAARATTLGAYYRLRPEINDYHAALNETGALYVSAMVHPGWFHPKAGMRSSKCPLPDAWKSRAISSTSTTGALRPETPTGVLRSISATRPSACAIWRAPKNTNTFLYTPTAD